MNVDYHFHMIIPKLWSIQTDGVHYTATDTCIGVI